MEELQFYLIRRARARDAAPDCGAADDPADAADGPVAAGHGTLRSTPGALTELSQPKQVA